ncbi:MAG: hypothetical protein CMK09_11555 [Ponticaulis sp.]|nr:hypothetical protein [Ponticaulis sp.]|tara:strand:- start:1061 stop:1465 length:405 start_codon:yes stop_codon:yes gene_type:complete
MITLADVFSSFSLDYEDFENGITKTKKPEKWGLGEELIVRVGDRFANLTIDSSDQTYQNELTKDLRKASLRGELLFGVTLTYYVTPSTALDQELLTEFFQLKSYGEYAQLYAHFSMELADFTNDEDILFMMGKR